MIRVAISGGGLVGASLTHPFLVHPHIDVHIFKSAPYFKEAGAAVGIDRIPQTALDLIGPSAATAPERAGAVPLLGVRFMLAQGDSPNGLIDEAIDLVGGNASRKLEHIGTAQDSVTTLRLADGSTHKCDIRIGADGILSLVRKYILGANNPTALLMHAGNGNGPVNIEDAREYMWIGDNTYLIHNVFSTKGSSSSWSSASATQKRKDPAAGNSERLWTAIRNGLVISKL
ncbi:6-methylsalicylic acid decarboxylase atA [Paramyrothecium foliicola]|nr:6-methylsalicylic acid decarboxylase atA [Paramyrothecium foliicola]